MGLFLRKKRKRGRPSRARRSTSLVRPWDPHRTLVGLRILLAVAVAAGVVFGWRWSEQALGRYVNENRAAEVVGASVRLSPAPSWMSRMLRDDLQTLVASTVGHGPLDDAGVRRAVMALESSPWVSQVRQVRRTSGGRVTVEAEYRRPIALVQAPDGYRLVDGGGVCLPGLYLEHQVDSLGLPVLIGVAASAPHAGGRWPGEDLRSGLSLASLLETEPYVDQVSAIDLGRRDTRGRMRLALCTRSGGMVRWGLPPGEERSIEPDAATKKQRLVEIYRRRGQIDDGGKVVDIFGADVFIHNTEAVGGDEPRRIGYTWR